MAVTATGEAASTIAVPGQRLGLVTKYAAGRGTHIHAAQVCASVAGLITTTPPHPPSAPAASAAAGTKPTTALPILSIRSSAGGGGGDDGAVVLPDVNARVLCRVTRIRPREANVSILVVDDKVVGEGGEFGGVIRAQDVRATEKDKVRIATSFRPGDIVRATVISLGDQQSYYLSTAGNELGVVLARSEAGNVMFPRSWMECVDPVTGAVEARKVAKPF
ncbi:MAG: exosome 3'-_5 exonuclease subunit ski4 (Csl4) [Thelocarpon impressellum]|nr:MAG: exosome 3'->5 exonuclease subunit ski4 (Csl4) [Thelocarpon impressellum]